MKSVLLILLTALVITGCGESGSKPAQEAKVATSNQPAFSNGYAPVNGLRMYYEIHGKGNPLVLIHGGGSTIQTTFGHILPLLAQQHKVIAVELQAHGHTSDRDSEETFLQDANDVAALLGHLKIERADFIGFSNGGHTAMQIGISHPSIVNKLIIISAFYRRDGAIQGFFDGMQQANLGNMPAQLKEAYMEITSDPSGLQRMFDKDRSRMLRFTDWKDEELAAIKAPTLLIAGDKDVVTPEHSVKMSRLIPNAQLMILPGTHGSFIGEICSGSTESKMPQLTVEAMEEFLRHP